MEELNWINHRERAHPTVTKREPPKIDPDIAKHSGLKVPVNDPRLMRLVVEWKNKTGTDPENVDKMDYMARNPEFIAELKKRLGVS